MPCRGVARSRSSPRRRCPVLVEHGDAPDRADRRQVGQLESFGLGRRQLAEQEARHGERDLGTGQPLVRVATIATVWLTSAIAAGTASGTR